MKQVNATVSRKVRRPTANAKTAGATPNDICTSAIDDECSFGIFRTKGRDETYEVGQRIEFLAYHAAGLSPPRNFAVEEIKHQSRKGEQVRHPQIRLVVRKEVPRRREHGE